MGYCAQMADDAVARVARKRPSAVARELADESGRSCGARLARQREHENRGCNARMRARAHPAASRAQRFSRRRHTTKSDVDSACEVESAGGEDPRSCRRLVVRHLRSLTGPEQIGDLGQDLNLRSAKPAVT